MIARGESAAIAENFGAYLRERPTDKLEQWAPAGVPAQRRA
jgi:hypothetical protein